MEKKYLVGYKDGHLVFGHGDIAPILGIKPIDFEEAYHAAIQLPSNAEVIVYELVPVKVFPADHDQRIAVALEEPRQSIEK
jgi:hypothetical protein